ncbi:MAG TPA: signal recognition particle-docking protein FtsY [Candidatus Xenobia bacterium]|jgi:fused signal recognition particle receptor
MLDRFKRKREADPEGLTEAEIEAADKLADAPASEAKGGWFASLRQAKATETPAEARGHWLDRLKSGLTRTRQSFVGSVQNLFKTHAKIDDDLWDELETILLQGDVGTTATDRILEGLQRAVKERKLQSPLELQLVLRDDMARLVGTAGAAIEYQPAPPTVILVVGVNGTGKTTSIAKLTFFFRMQGYSVMLAAADTFRAAAIDQLQIWADRLNVDLIKHKENSDPAAVAYDAINAAKARQADILLIDTAGRLHSKANLMEELKKIWRVLGRELPGAPHECLLILDATTGQNAMVQAKVFKEAVGITGVILTKMDGTARGGVVISIANDLQVPVKFIGVGEAMDDLHEFSGEDFIDALFAQAG